MLALEEAPRVLSSTPGRLRVHLPGWGGADAHVLETRLRSLPGIHSVQANPLTSNVLLRYDTVGTAAARILDALGSVPTPPHPLTPGAELAARIHTVTERHGHRRRARITVRGLDRDPDLGRRVVEALQQRQGVRATATPLTGRVLVEFGEAAARLEDLIADVERLELPDLPGEDRPRHPLDPAPLVQSTVRVCGAAVGLGFIVARRLLGAEVPLVPVGIPARVAGVLGLVQGFPFIRRGLRRMLGRSASDVLMYAPVMVSLALSESVLGLALTGVEAARLLTEILARRASWRRYEDRLAEAPSHHPGALVRVDAGQRAPRAADIVEGTGVAVGRDGLPRPVAPGGRVKAGARLYGGPFTLVLCSAPVFEPEARSEPSAPTILERYVSASGLASLAYASLTGLLRGSSTGFLEGLLLLNPRAAVVGADIADVSAAERVLRAGVVVVGTRPERTVRRPDWLLLDYPRMLADGFELVRSVALEAGLDARTVQGRAAAVAHAAGTPWGLSFPMGAGERMPDAPVRGARGPQEATVEHGTFDGVTAEARCDGVPHRLGPAEMHNGEASTLTAQDGEYALVLQRAAADGWRTVGAVVLRPRLADGLDALLETCRRRGVRLGVLKAGDADDARATAARAGVPLIEQRCREAIRSRQAEGARVAFASDGADAAEAFALCDLAIGLSTGRSGRFPARADLLAPDLGALAAIVETGALRELAVRDSVALSLLANVVGTVWGLRGQPGVERASQPVYVGALVATAAAWWRLRGGERARSLTAELADPHPEKWGRRSTEEILRALRSDRHGLTADQARGRRRQALVRQPVDTTWKLLLDQLRNPMPGILGSAAALALLLDAPLDFVLIVATLAVNVAVGMWQEYQTGRAVEALERTSAPVARVLRDGRPLVMDASEIVPGDVLTLAPGDRIGADARLIDSHGLEVDEAALTGESHPVRKSPSAPDHASRVVLEGTDVVVGRGRAVVFAVGRQTRMGATAAALAHDEGQHTPLGLRLTRMFRQVLPLATVGGATVVASHVLRGRPLLPSLGIGASIALAAVPEGLPLLAGLGQAAVSRRLGGRRVLVRRLSAVEATGRVDVACTDKTGTLTEGRLAVGVVAGVDVESAFPAPLPEELRRVLLAAALACPHPEAADAAAHPTDAAVIRAAEAAGLGSPLRADRERDVPFDPARPFHAAQVRGRLYVKGAPEEVAPRCSRMLRREGVERLPEGDRQALLSHAWLLAQRGLRVLMVAEGDAGQSADAPEELLAVGFLGIRDPVRANVPAAVDACHRAGIRVVMLTGDHPATARAIASEAGLAQEGSFLLTGSEIAELSDEELDGRLEEATVIARATPLDKMRIVESLQRRRHTVAMTGDGVNDAPALRLADVGVAMGRGGTEVARQAADLVLWEDDFESLVEALIEGRSFWRNMRRALGLLLGGNLGELGLVVAASLVGLPPPLTTRQILAVNLLTDALPAMSIIAQPPEHKNLSRLAREGVAGLDVALRRDVLQRGVSTALPSLVGYVAAMGSGGLLEARSVAFASVVVTQLGQTLDAGWSEGGFSHPVMRGVGASVALLAAAFAVPPLRGLFELSLGPVGWLAPAAAAVAAVVVSRVLGAVPLPLLSPGDASTAARPAPRERGAVERVLPTA